MDETAISNAVQQALNAHSVRSQVKRRGTELHVLLKRSEGHDVDYANLYDIISGTLEKLPLEDTNKLMVYGMVDGTKKPEWERSGVLHIALPVIELEIDDMNGAQEFNINGLDANQPLTDIDGADLGSSLGNNLGSGLGSVPAAGLPKSFDATIGGAAAVTSSGDIGWAVAGQDSGFFNLQAPGELTPLSLSIGQADPDSSDFSLPPLPAPTQSFIPDHGDTTGGRTRSGDTSGFTPPPTTVPTPSPSFDFMDDLGDPNAMTELVTPPPPPPTEVTNDQPDPNSPSAAPMNPEPSNGKQRNNNLALLSVAGGIIGLGLIAGGWYAWDISNQSQKIAEVKENIAKLPPENTRTKPDVQKSVREQINTAIVNLESIPDRPGYPYAEAQTKIATLKQDLKKMDTPDPVVQAKALAKEASVLVQNGPHPAKVWQDAQGKWQQSVTLLGKVPRDAPNHAEAQETLKKYRSNLSQVTSQLQRQQKVEALRKEVSPNVLNDLKQLKAKGTPKAEFLASCAGRLNNTFTVRDAQQVGLKTVKQLTSQLCVAL